MLRCKILHSLLIACAVLSSALLAHGQAIQSRLIQQNVNITKESKYVWAPSQLMYKSLAETQAPTQKDDEKDKEVLTPLTDEERSFNPRDLVATQPDFVADLSFFYGEGFVGMSGGEHIARKGKRYREE